MKPIFLDTETTGNAPGQDRLCSICYKMEDQLVHELFKPPVPITVDAMAVHHITNRMVEDKGLFEESETKAELKKILDDNILVAHNAAFDIGILETEGLNVPRHICTLRVARHLDGEEKIPRFGLQYLRYLLDLNVENAPAHDARGDVLMAELSQKPVLLRTMRFGKYKGMPFDEIAKKDKGYLQWLLGARQKDAAGSNKYGDDADLMHTLQTYAQ